MRRVRVTYSRGEETRFLGHLDFVRIWPRAFRRAGISFLFTEGFNPQPRILFAAPLPVGVTGDHELFDVYLDGPVTTDELIARLANALPAGVGVSAAVELPTAGQSLPALVRAAVYEATVDTSESRAAIQARVDAALSATELRRERVRQGKTKRYDLRPLIHALELTERGAGSLRLRMDLRHDVSGAGRPEEVLAALELNPDSRVHRTRILLADSPEPAPPSAAT